MATAQRPSSSTSLAATIARVVRESGVDEEVMSALKSPPHPSTEGSNSGGAAAKRRRGADDGGLVKQYEDFTAWVAGSLDAFRDELLPLTYALFAHTYLELLKRGADAAALEFMRRHGDADHGLAHGDELAELRKLTRWDGSEEALDEQGEGAHSYVRDLISKRFKVVLSKFTKDLLVTTLLEKRMSRALELINRGVAFPPAGDVPAAAVRGGESLAARATVLVGEAEASADFFTGMDAEARVKLNAKPVRWRVPMMARRWLTPFAGGADDALAKLAEPDSRVDAKGTATPLWESYESAALASSPFLHARWSEANKAAAAEEGGAKEKSSPSSAALATPSSSSSATSTWPSIAMISLLNAGDAASCACSSPDAKVVAAGFEDSRVRVWTAHANEPFGTTSQLLVGHAGPVHGASLTADADRLVTCSSDGTTRLWATQPASGSDGVGRWGCVAVYKPTEWAGRASAVWSADMAPYGYYFVTGGHDRVARLWRTESNAAPVRVFSGHLSDVDCVHLHPNVHYVATGSSDKTVRLWDVRDANPARVFVGHTSSVSALRFDASGRYLASGGRDGLVFVWDVATGARSAVLEGHESHVTALDWSPSGDFLATGSADSSVMLWPTAARYDSVVGEMDASIAFSESALVARKFPTKFTPLLHLNFIKPDVLVGAGAFLGG